MGPEMNIFVTGGAGYIGSILVPSLLRAGHQITVLDNFLYQQSSLLDCITDENLKVVRGDARDRVLVASLMEVADFIIPLACLVGAPLCKKDPAAAESINLGAIEMILELRRPEQKIIFPTTNSGYGVGESGKHCTEDSPLNPISLYGKMKVEAETKLLQSGNCITLRLATVFGMSPRMRLDLLVNDFTYRAVNDSAIVLFEGHFKRNFVHVKDVADCFIYCINNFDEMKNENFNVGLSNANLSKVQLCERIQEYIPGFCYLEAPIGKDPDQRNYIISNKKIESAGFKATNDLNQGIRELIKGYQIVKRGQYSNI